MPPPVASAWYVRAVSRGSVALQASVCTGFGCSVLHTTQPSFMKAELAVRSSTDAAWAMYHPLPVAAATVVLASTRLTSVSAALS